MKKIDKTSHPGIITKLSPGILAFLLTFLPQPQQALASPVAEYATARQSVEKVVTLKMANRPLVEILAEIKKQTGISYGFRDNREVSPNNLFSVDVSNVSVTQALDKLFEGSKFTYQISNNLILVSPKEAQAPAGKIRGRVVDEKGNSVIGATVLVHGTMTGTATDANGRYTIQAAPDDVLKISAIGYDPQTVIVEGRTTVDVRLMSRAEDIGEVTVVAFGEQKKESVVSAITTVKPMDLKTSNSDLTSSFAGKIAGIIGWQTGGIPGALTDEEMNTKFVVRGITSFQTTANVDPLILIDGVESAKLDLSRLSPEDIESFSVLKDASATAMYGARGANGVILVATKKGHEGSVYTSFRYEVIASMPTREIDVVDPVTYMKMYNKALLSRTPSASPTYSVERIRRTNNPNYPSFAYPANDWYNILFKDRSINHHVGLNIRGGSKIVQYYSSLNYNRDTGMLKTDRLNQYDCNIVSNTVSFLTNLNINLHAGIQLLINSTGTLDSYHGPITDVRQAYNMAFAASPVDFAALYPGDEVNGWPHLRFGGLGLKVNPYLEIQKGYMERSRYSAKNKIEYIHNLSALVKGLEARASVAMSNVGYFANPFATVPFQYELINYDDQTGKHVLNPMNGNMARRTLQAMQPTSTTKTQMTYEARLMHTASWGHHQSSLTAVFNGQESNQAPVSDVLNGMPQRNLSFSMRGTYGFKDRYFAEASFGYNGSERFSPENKWGFFPAGGLAWIVSRENFMRSTSKWLDQLKLRVSYGRVGNDGIILDPRFVYLSKIVDKDVFDMRPGAGGGMTKVYTQTTYGNPDIEWEIAETVNLGLETSFWNGMIECNIDAYQEIRHNILSHRTVIPSTMGFEVLQLANIGQARSRGLDFSGKFQYQFNKDFWMILSGTLTYSKVIFQKIEEAADKAEWQKKVGHELSQPVGYIAEGLFRDLAEIASAPPQGGDVMPGDIRYRDVNKDGVIDVNDAVHIGYPEVPRLIYGFSGTASYKGIDLSFSFQGSGQRTFFIDPVAISPFVDDHAMLRAIYEDHWSSDDMKTRPFWPRLSTRGIAQHNPQEDWYNPGNKETRKSTYFMRECSFLRCTSIELGYNLPEKFKKKLRMSNVKFYVRANNPFLISNFDLWDVELGENGFNYPIQKTYSLGLNFSF